MEYLIGALILGTIWITIFLFRRDLQKEILWSSVYGLAICSAIFLSIKIFLPNLPSEMTFIPGYWDPDTLFNLGRITGGYSIEDVLFIFFVSGIAASAYELLFRKQLGKKHSRHKPHLALIIGTVAGILTIFFGLNLIYFIIAFCTAGAATIWLQRPNLIMHSLCGGISFLLIYVLSFQIFLLLFPSYIEAFYSLHNLSSILLAGIPLEEYAFAFSFGLLWSPIYEYVKDVR